MLQNLPSELLLQVVHFIDRKRDLAALCRASHLMHSVAAARLYGEINFGPHDVGASGIFDWKSYELALGRHAPLVEDVVLGPGFRQHMSCPHATKEPATMVESRHYRDSVEKIGHVISMLPDGSMRRFGWHAGGCFPFEFFRKSERMLQKTQPQLQELSLYTTEMCLAKRDVKSDFSGFKQLRILAWHGIKNLSELVLLGILATPSLPLVTSLAIGFNYHIEPHVKKVALFTVEMPKLQHLYLQRASLLHVATRITQTLNFGRLRSLKLDGCYGSGELLARLAASEQEFPLTTFHFIEKPTKDNFEPSDPDFDGEESVSRVLPDFLRKFQSISHLYLRLFQCNSWPEIGAAACNRHHMYEVVFEHDDVGTVTVHNATPVSNYNDEMVSSMMSPSICKLGLEVFGIPARPPKLERALRPLASRCPFKLLHIRYRRGSYAEDDEDLQFLLPDHALPSEFPDDEGDPEFEYQIASGSESSESDGSESSESDGSERSDDEWTEPDLEQEIQWLNADRLEHPLVREGTSARFPYPLLLPGKRNGVASRYPPASAAEDVERLPLAVRAFAQWAFGPDGLPELLVLAVGEFYPKDRSPHTGDLLCRRRSSEASPAAAEAGSAAADTEWAAPSRTFRRISDEDERLKEYVASKMEGLAACGRPDQGVELD